MPKHVHVFKDSDYYGKVEIPSFRILEERRKIPKIVLCEIQRLVDNGVI